MRFLWLPILFSCAACGGHSAVTIERPADESAGASVATNAQPTTNGGAADVVEAAGAASEPDNELAGAAGDSGAPGYVPHIGSATRNCESADTCFGQACYAPTSFLPTVCVANCETDFDCSVNEVCVRSSKLAPTCYPRCGVPGDCEYHFDCMDFSGAGQWVCFPAGWAGRRDELD